MNDNAMTETPIDREISTELARIRVREEVIPFLGEMLTVAEVEFRPLPDEMRAIIQSSPDFVSIVPGAGSTWLNIEGEDLSNGVQKGPPNGVGPLGRTGKHSWIDRLACLLYTSRCV